MIIEWSECARILSSVVSTTPPSEEIRLAKAGFQVSHQPWTRMAATQNSAILGMSGHALAANMLAKPKTMKTPSMA